MMNHLVLWLIYSIFGLRDPSGPGAGNLTSASGEKKYSRAMAEDNWRNRAASQSESDEPAMAGGGEMDEAARKEWRAGNSNDREW